MTVDALDLGEPSSVAELFTPDGVWEWRAGDRRVEGRDALRRYFGSRPADRARTSAITRDTFTKLDGTWLLARRGYGSSVRHGHRTPVTEVRSCRC